MRTVDPERHRARRRHILDAAAGLFAAKGFDGTSTAEICRAAGISTGSLFHYFPSKRDIFVAVITDDGDDGEDHLAAALAADDPWDGLLGFIDHLCEAATVPGVPALVLEAMMQATRDEALAEAMGDGSQAEEDGLTALIARAAGAGMIDPELDPAHAASWVMALVSTLYLTAATSDHFHPAKELPTLRLVVTRFLRPR